MTKTNKDLGDYQVRDQRVETTGYMRDTSRPFLVTHRYYRGYKSGMSIETIGRYATRATALAAIRRHTAR